VNWDKFDLHIENLAPGVVTLALALHLVSRSQIVAHAPASPFDVTFIAGATFIAAAYLIGIVAVAVSRIAIDPVSEFLPRPVLLRWHYQDRFQGKNRREINDAYRKAIHDAQESQNDNKWTEVRKRRERGRLIRTALVPLLIIPWMIFSGSPMAILAAELIGYVFVLVLYAYIEVTIFQECIL
jgi:hypothetical protein